MTIEIKQGLFLKSSDNEYIYNIFSLDEKNEKMEVNILNRNLETIASRWWSISEFKSQLNAGTIDAIKEGEMLGV